MKVDVTVDDKELRESIKKLKEDAKKDLGAALIDIGDTVRNAAKKGIRDQSPRSGNLYKRRLQSGKGYKEVRGAAKGEYPLGFSGTLDKNIFRYIDNQFKIRVVAEAIYSARLEYEYEMPFMQKAIEDSDKQIDNIIKKLADRVVGIKRLR